MLLSVVDWAVPWAELSAGRRVGGWAVSMGTRLAVVTVANWADRWVVPMDDGWVDLLAEQSVPPTGADWAGWMASNSAVSTPVSKHSHSDEWSAESLVEQTELRWGIYWAA